MGNTMRGSFLTDKQRQPGDASENAWREQAKRAERGRQMRFRDEIPHVATRAFIQIHGRTGTSSMEGVTWEEVHTWLTALATQWDGDSKA